MVERDDIESLLSTGSWRTSRSRSPNPYRYTSERRHYEPSRTNISAALAPRPSSSSFSSSSFPRAKRPPPPCVEDEQASLAKEYIGPGTRIVSTVLDEEPKNRGEIDQQPIILPVHEYNPERRFIIVPKAADDDESKTVEARSNANTCRKYILVHGDKTPEVVEPTREDKRRPEPAAEKADHPEPKEEVVASERRDLPKRKSHQDLPRLTTSFGEPEPSICRSSSRRDRERPFVHQDAHPSPPSGDKASAKPDDSAFLSPNADVRYPAGGRSRAYSNARSETGRRPSRSPSRRDADIEVADRRRPHHSSRYPESAHRSSKHHERTGSHRRSSSSTNMPPQDDLRAERPKSSFIQSIGYGDPEDIFAFMAPGDDFMTGKSSRGASPPRRTRNNDSPPPHPRGAREMPNSSPSRRRTYRPSPRDRNEYSSDEDYRMRRPKGADRPYPPRTTLEPEYPSLTSPEGGRRSSPAIAAAAIPPAMAAAHAALFPDDAQPSPRGASFPVEKARKADERSQSSSPANNTSPTRRPIQDGRSLPLRPQSRDPSASGASNASASVLPPSSSSLPRSSTLERMPTRPVTTIVRQDSAEPRSPPYAPRPSSQVAKDVDVYDDDDDDDDDDGDDIGLALARLPDCRWKSPALVRRRGSGDQFFTLKRAENFRICSDCFASFFADTEFQHHFVPVSKRVGDQVTVCDFGASPWYRIAFLMTLKYSYPDLRLLQGIALIAAQSQPCPGSKPASRIWYGMVVPHSRSTIQNFSVCFSCAKSVEVLLPNLAGVFVPLDSHEPTRGICELQFAPDRRRFFEYFEQMKAASDLALTRRTAPSIASLAERIQDIACREECPRNASAHNHRWHVMEQVPDLTVCDECFKEVVWPMIQDKGNTSAMPRNFYKERLMRAVASCQLYSERMRQVFATACRYDDFDYLSNVVLDRMRVMAEVKARYRELQREDQEDPKVQAELAALERRFREVE
ncbi:hypothetical protein VTJ83DRAFT_3465 [Remersonia thermophila]|uniref:Uncharacterized protein n=1 Tax=Remersonia thermophila TaxID=72144 RepID=A0ABR4DGC7_9PEZI